MEILYFLGGAILGAGAMVLYMYKHTMHGIVELDHKKRLCNAVLPEEAVMDRRLKKVVLKVVHDVDIPIDDHD